MTKKERKAIQKAEEIAEIAKKASILQADYMEELEQNPKYSLIVDPEGTYCMTSEQKSFVKFYIDTKSIASAAELAGIDISIAKEYYESYPVQQEIRRIFSALCHRQFQAKLLSIDEIGGWLTSLLTETNISSADKPDLATKLRIAQMIIDLNKFKIAGLQNPSIILTQNIEADLRSLSVDTIRQLLAQSDKPRTTPLIMSDETRTMEEAAYLETLSNKELLEIIEKENSDETEQNGT